MEGNNGHCWSSCSLSSDTSQKAIQAYPLVCKYFVVVYFLSIAKNFPLYYNRELPEFILVRTRWETVYVSNMVIDRFIASSALTDISLGIKHNLI